MDLAPLQRVDGRHPGVNYAQVLKVTFSFVSGGPDAGWQT
jgi:hypothetical protein